MMKEVEIGDGSRLIDLPKSYHVETEDDGAVLAYIPQKDSVNLRISVVTVSHKSNDVSSLAFDDVIRDAKAKGLEPKIMGDKSYFSYTEDSMQNGEPLKVVYWMIGAQNSFVVMSATVIKRLESEPEVVPFLNDIPRIIRSIRAKNS